MKISILGAGNGGQAMAGHFASLGHDVALFNRNLVKLGDMPESRTIKLQGSIEVVAKLSLVTDDIQSSIDGSELIMVTTTADAHKSIANEIAQYVVDGQVIVLNPGRTLGAIEFSNELRKRTKARVYIAEAQSLIYACRALSPGLVRIIGVKQKVPVASYPSSDTENVVRVLNSVHSCFHAVDNVLVSSLENIGAILHPTIVLLNTGSIDRGEYFQFYSDITQPVANFVNAVDLERIAIGSAFGISLHSIYDWVSVAYGGIPGETLYDRITSNPAYSQIQAPTSLNTRYLMEDVPTGILPMTELAHIVNVSTPLMNSIFNFAQALLKRDFRSEGRTLANLKIGSVEDLLKGL
jgi:opine dehydrogenase